MEKEKNRVRNLFILSTSIFCVLLLFFSFLAIRFSYQDKHRRITSSMEIITTYTKQEYSNILSNYWQIYMPIYDETENILLLNNMFSSDYELDPYKKKNLSELLTKMSLRDNRISWIALYSSENKHNYIQYYGMASINDLPSDFPYISDLNTKEKRMEIYGMRTLPGSSAAEENFAISGGLPNELQTGSVIAGYKTTSLTVSKDLFPDSVHTMQYYIVSNEQIVYSSNGNYSADELFIPTKATKGVYVVNGIRKYLHAVSAGNATSYVVCMVDEVDMMAASYKDMPLLLIIIIAFFAFSIFLSSNIQKQISQEVTVIKEGLIHLNDNNLDYRLPTDFRQSGLPEIAQDINAMSSRLNESIKKAYYFELKQKDAEMAELQATFNPHFLYNSLEILRSKSYNNEDYETAELISNLASIFRGFIGAKTFVSFREELAFSKKYLSLLIARYGDKVAVHYDIDSELLNYGIIRNVFQLLIENYFVHGFDAQRENNRIDFIGRVLDNDKIRIYVKDNGYGMTDDEITALNQSLEQPIRHNKENFGLKNLHQRLKLFYGPDYGLHIEKNETGGITVFITIYKMTLEEYEKKHQTIKDLNNNPPV